MFLEGTEKGRVGRGRVREGRGSGSRHRRLLDDANPVSLDSLDDHFRRLLAYLRVIGGGERGLVCSTENKVAK